MSNERINTSTAGVGAIIDHEPVSGLPWLIYANGLACRVKDQKQAFRILVGQILYHEAHDEKISVVDPPPRRPDGASINHLAHKLAWAEDTARKIIHRALKDEADRRWHYRQSAIAQTTRELTGAGLVWEDTFGPYSDIPIPENFTHRIAQIEDGRAITVRIGTEAAMQRAWQNLYAGSNDTYIIDRMDGATSEETDLARHAPDNGDPEERRRPPDNGDVRY